MANRLKIGDIFQISLSNEMNAFGQYIYLDKYGPLVQVYKLILDNNSVVSLEQIVASGKLFPPIYTAIKAAIRNEMWTIIGNYPVINFQFSPFVSTFYDQKTGKAGIWFLWDGKKTKKVGKKLLDKHKTLEYLIVWSPFDVIDRIETGQYPFPYRELMENNEYTPRNK